jgi:hypothetical protein
MTERNTRTHKVTVKQSSDEAFEALRDTQPWTARCSCGWSSDPRTSEERAEHEAAVHLAEQEA